MNDVVIHTTELEISMENTTGRILSIRRSGNELARPADRAFSMQLLDGDGNAVCLDDRDFSCCRYSSGVFSYSGCARFPQLTFEIRIRVSGKFIAFTNAVSGIPENQVLEWVDAPQVHVPEKSSLFVPLHDGVVIRDPSIRQKGYQKYHPLEFTKRGQSFGRMFPGRCMMQFLADYSPAGGLFFAAFDRQAIPKAVEYEPLENGDVRLSLQTFTGCGFGSGYTTPFEYVLTGFDGGWMRAASIYRDWYDSVAPAPRPLPKWLEKSPVVIIYPVRGTGLDHGRNQLKENCYYPYENALPWIKELKQEFGSAVMALLMHWEGTAPWAPPYVWPPLGGEKLLASFRDALHSDGDLLGLYCSGTAWTQTSSITDYSQEKRFSEEHLERFMLRGPKGEIDAEVCNGPQSQRLGYDMCLSEEWSREQVRQEVAKISRFGADYCQYFDQNHGGGQVFCYSRQHHHPPVPGPAQTEACATLLRSLTEEIRASGSEMALGCESSAAEPFVNDLPLNDARPSFLWGLGCPVPAQSFVFHGRTCCFAGNQCGLQGKFDFNASPENLLFRLAYAFNAGDLLSVTLKENGLIHWGWAIPWNEDAPEQQNVKALIRNLNAVRREFPEYLLHGRMQEIAEPAKCGNWILKLKDRTEEMPSVLESVWEAPGHTRIRLLTNYLPQEQQVILKGKTLTVPALSAIVLREK